MSSVRGIGGGEGREGRARVVCIRECDGDGTDALKAWFKRAYSCCPKEQGLLGRKVCDSRMYKLSMCSGHYSMMRRKDNPFGFHQ